MTTEHDQLAILQERKKMFSRFGTCKICCKNPTGKYQYSCRTCKDDLVSISDVFKRRHPDNLMLNFIDKYKDGEISRQALEIEIVKFKQRYSGEK